MRVIRHELVLVCSVCVCVRACVCVSCDDDLIGWLVGNIELLKINSYKVPRDKLVCILNCCKILYNSLQNGASPAGADDFLPLLIYAVIKAAPPRLHSNIQYVAVHPVRSIVSA
jgi:hypothetical protein